MHMLRPCSHHAHTCTVTKQGATEWWYLSLPPGTLISYFQWNGMRLGIDILVQIHTHIATQRHTRHTRHTHVYIHTRHTHTKYTHAFTHTHAYTTHSYMQQINFMHATHSCTHTHSTHMRVYYTLICHIHSMNWFSAKKDGAEQKHWHWEGWHQRDKGKAYREHRLVLHS